VIRFRVEAADEAADPLHSRFALSPLGDALAAIANH
jgi:hypothetical protein